MVFPVILGLAIERWPFLSAIHRICTPDWQQALAIRNFAASDLNYATDL